MVGGEPEEPCSVLRGACFGAEDDAVDLEIGTNLAKRTENAKMGQKGCGKVRFVRICPLMPASSAYARLILGGRDGDCIGVSVCGGIGDEAVTAKRSKAFKNAILAHFVSLGLALFRFISLGFAWRWRGDDCPASSAAGFARGKSARGLAQSKTLARRSTLLCEGGRRCESAILLAHVGNLRQVLCRQGPWNVDLRIPPGQECSNGSLLCIRRGHPGTFDFRLRIGDFFQ